MDLTSIKFKLTPKLIAKPKARMDKCLGCRWKQVDACNLIRFDKDNCPLEQKVMGME